MRACDARHKAHITELKTLKKPPVGVKRVMASVCMLLGVRPRASDGDYWPASAKLLADATFLNQLKSFDPSCAHVSRDTMNRIRRFVAEWTPEGVKRVSAAAYGVCIWVHAVFRYAKIARNHPSEMKAVTIAKLRVKKHQALVSSFDLDPKGVTKGISIQLLQDMKRIAMPLRGVDDVAAALHELPFV